MKSATTERTYIFNLETGKIELHFEKSEYKALPEESKKLLKSNFLFSRYSSAWVSRCKEPNLYRARQVAEKLGFTQEQRAGERLSFAEQVERQAERAEARAERFEGYAENADKRRESLQAGFNSHRGDIAWLTQPNINSSGGRAFTNYRNKVMDRYNKGFEEYRKSQYFMDRATTAQNTADMKKFSNPIYLDNRIKECKKNVRAIEKNIVCYEERLERIEKGEVLKDYNGEVVTAERYEKAIVEALERLEAEMDKQGYMENCLDEIGGNRFSKDNIKTGYIVNVRGSGRCEVVSAGPVNITYKILDGGAAGMVLKDAYAAISEVIEAKEENKALELIANPFKEGDILCKHRPADDSIYRAFQVVKVTKTGVKIQRIEVENGKPIANQFISDKAMQKKIVKSKFSDFVGVYDDDWQLHKYTGD